MSQAVIFFDGVCNLCNSSVQFIIRRDKDNYFKFASLQSEFGQDFLAKHNLPKESFSSFILFENNRIYQKSTAALRVSRKLRGLWFLLYIYIIVPPFIRNWVYSIVAKNRYNWFGKKEECMVPSKELKSKFIN